MKILIVGSSSAKDEDIANKAKEIGSILASKGYLTVTGGVTGYPDLLAQSAIESGGKVEAYCGGKSIQDHNLFYNTDLSKYTKLIFQESYVGPKFSRIDLYMRSLKMCFYSDIAIVIGGRVGTLYEITIMAGLAKDVYVLSDSGGITANTIKEFIKEGHKEQSKIVFFNNFKELESLI